MGLFIYLFMYLFFTRAESKSSFDHRVTWGHKLYFAQFMFSSEANEICFFKKEEKFLNDAYLFSQETP